MKSDFFFSCRKKSWAISIWVAALASLYEIHCWDRVVGLVEDFRDYLAELLLPLVSI